jgi:predicted HAD superfamily phosphohydrolase YqeG
MIYRIWYALTMAYRQRPALARYSRDLMLQCNTIVELDLHRLKSQGIKVLVFDFDGVLASHAQVELTQNVESWLKECLKIFGPASLFILSNKPDEARIRYFSIHFPDIGFVISKRKKPYPDGLLQILQLTSVAPGAVLMLDDRLLTGVLAAILANVSARLITRPFIAFKKRPLSELFYLSLRAFERLVF